jgi:hypothetical protein
MSRIGAFGAAVMMMTQLCAAAFVVNFETPFQPVRPAAGARGAVGGEICPPPMENSSGWANVDNQSH